MHPLGLYLAITDSKREQGWIAADDRRCSYARVDAVPIAEPDRVSRIGRMAAMVRRHVVRMAGA
jgi:hypothetical protein